MIGSSTRCRAAAAALAALCVVSGCGGGGERRDQAGAGAGAGAGNGDELPVLADDEAADLPTLPDRPGDTVLVSPSPASTTTTTVPQQVVIPSDVLFDTNQATLKPDAGPPLEVLADEIRAGYPNAGLHFVGHTDSRGGAEANMDLSVRRARAVADWFADHGFDPAKLTTAGAGESQPLAPDTPAGVYDESVGGKNRRVAIVIVS